MSGATLEPRVAPGASNGQITVNPGQLIEVVQRDIEEPSGEKFPEGRLVFLVREELEIVTGGNPPQSRAYQNALLNALIEAIQERKAGSVPFQVVKGEIRVGSDESSSRDIMQIYVRNIDGFYY